MSKTKQPDLTALLMQVLQVAMRIVESGDAATPTTSRAKTTGKKAAAGIYPHQSKYNPWRCYVWDKHLHATIYLGAFPSVNKAKQAQADYRAGRAISSGTRASSPRALPPLH